MKRIVMLLAIGVMASSAIEVAGAQDQTATQNSTPPQDAPAEEPAHESTAAAPADAPYKVVDGSKVDEKTLNGWKTWRALACERCHGAEQEGLVGPALVDSLKKLSKQEFHDTIFNGRPEKGMPPFSGSQMVTTNWEGLYAYLKGRSDGAIKPGHLYPIEAK